MGWAALLLLLLPTTACQSSDWGAPPASGPPASPAPGWTRITDAKADTGPLTSGADAGLARPRLFLSPDTLAALRARARAGAPSWSALRARCEEYAGGRVEYPDGADYPGKGNIGEGYQGQGYFEPLLELSLCFQIERTLDSTGASRYARKGIEVLAKMSEKEGPHAPPLERDSGYGIRFYGVGMAIAYDWLHSEMSPDERKRVYEAQKQWIDAYEKNGFGRDHPQGNYFAGYYAAKGLGALSTEGDNPRAETEWRDFLARVHKGSVAPYYAAHLTGGGWPEGWGYGALASLNMSLPTWGARTAKGIDLVRDVQPGFTYPLDQARYLLHFSWPSRKTLDDRGTFHAGDSLSAFDPMLAYVAWRFASMWGDPIAPAFHTFAREVKEAAGTSTTGLEPWVAMLFWDEKAPEEPFDAMPRSYLAKGMQSVAMRSSWGKDAVWASFGAGPYVNNPDSSEMLFDQGSLSIVRGDRPLLVYAPTRLIKSGGGGNSSSTQDATRLENRVYESLFGERAERALFNVYYAKPPSLVKYGQVANTSAKTAVGRFEDRGDFVFTRGEHLEEAYRPGTVASWTRQIVFFRPSLFVIDDRTEAADPHADQWLAFHLGTAPHAARSGRIDAGGPSDYAGALISLLPRGTKTTTVDVFDAHKVWRAEIRASKPRARQRWLTAFDASASPEQVAAAAPIAMTEGHASGAAFRRKDASYVLISAPDEAARIEGAISYTAPPGALHVVTDVTPGASYAVTATPRGGTTVRIVPAGSNGGGQNGTTARASAQGALAFRVDAGRKIEPLP